MVLSEHTEERAEDLDSSQRVRDHLNVYHFVPAISDFILVENREYCNNELEQTLKPLHSQMTVNEVKRSSFRTSLLLLQFSWQ